MSRWQKVICVKFMIWNKFARLKSESECEQDSMLSRYAWKFYKIDCYEDTCTLLIVQQTTQKQKTREYRTNINQ